MSDGVAAVDATPLRTVRRALARSLLVGSLGGVAAGLQDGAPAGLALAGGLVTLAGGCALVEGWARGRGQGVGAWVFGAAALLAPAALLQANYSAMVLGGAAPEQALARLLDPRLAEAFVVTASVAGVLLGLAARVRHAEHDGHAEIFKFLGALSIVGCCYGPVLFAASAVLVWSLAGVWWLADRVERALFPLVDRARLDELTRRVAALELSRSRLQAAAWVGDPTARALLGWRAPSPPDDLKPWVRGLGAFDLAAAHAAARAVSALAADEVAARAARGLGPEAPGTRQLELARHEAARAVGGDGAGDGVGAATRAAWTAAIAADALGEGPVRAAVREAVTAWALEERPG